MAVRTPDPAETLVAWQAGNSQQRIARDPTPLVTGAPYTLAGVNAALRDAVNPIIGADLVTNGGFDTDTDWTKGTGWTIDLGAATCDSQVGALSQLIAITAGNDYLVTFDLGGVFGVQGLGIILGGTTPIGYAKQARTYFFRVKAQVGTAQIAFDCGSPGEFKGTVDNVAVRQIT